MPETLDAFDELQKIRLRLDGIEETQEMLVRASAMQVLEDVDLMTDEDPLAARVYLLVDGVRTQQEIAAELTTSQQTVSNKLRKLRDLHLVLVIDQRGGGNVYAKAAADRILRLGARITRRLNQPAR
jgi:DNA-binding transcriptional ArsR family regulator